MNHFQACIRHGHMSCLQAVYDMDTWTICRHVYDVDARTVCRRDMDTWTVCRHVYDMDTSTVFLQACIWHRHTDCLYVCIWHGHTNCLQACMTWIYRLFAGMYMMWTHELFAGTYKTWTHRLFAGMYMTWMQYCFQVCIWHQHINCLQVYVYICTWVTLSINDFALITEKNQNPIATKFLCTQVPVSSVILQGKEPGQPDKRT